MATSNPAFSNSPAFTQSATKAIQWTQEPSAQQLDELYARSAATPDQMDRMTYENVIQKTLGAFVVLLAFAAVGWFVPGVWIVGGIVGFVLALVNIFKKEPSPALILAYAAAQGLFVGGISAFYQSFMDGIVVQAVMGTLIVVGVTLALFASGKIRASKRATKIFLIAMVGYAVFSLVNMGLMIFGVTDSMFGLRGEPFLGMPLGFWLGILVILMAAYSLVLDFDAVKTGVQRGAPAKYGWTAAFGIMVTVIWLYLEILRLLAILRGGE
ncbi:MAG: hypothetical protein C0444_08005 [Microbacterium sp.]|nr:hypothetical protein [Microbacterium sp.]